MAHRKQPITFTTEVLAALKTLYLIFPVAFGLLIIMSIGCTSATLPPQFCPGDRVLVEDREGNSRPSSHLKHPQTPLYRHNHRRKNDRHPNQQRHPHRKSPLGKTSNRPKRNRPNKMKTQITNPGSERHRIQLEALAEFLELDSIEYKDLGNGEDYILRRAGKELTLKIRGNKDQGGFLSIPTNRLKPLELS